MKDSLFANPFWEFEVLGNQLYDYVLAVGIFILLVIIFKGMQWVALRSVERVTRKTKTEWDDAVVTIIKTIKPPFYWYVAFYIALRYLNIEGLAQRVVSFILVAWLVYQVIVALRILIDFYVQQRLSKTDKGAQAATHVIHSLVGVALWIVGLLFLLQNFGVNVTSLIAGLGIGGIAIALAAQNVLADLFSSLAIFFDKPFVPGDFVEVGDNKGTVQKIGIKTTRVKALDGEEIVVPNTEMTGAVLKNIGRMKERRVVFMLGVVYETPTEKMRRVPGLVKDVITREEKVKFGRVHFKEFADFSLNFEVIYHVKDKDYAVYMDINERIMIGIKEAFEKEHIEMAYPTQMVYVNKT
jgi:small-conductance mechanosensitive channel